MASQSGNSSLASKNATLVGNAFVTQYYNVLHQSPDLVHRFYTDQSKLSRSEVGAKADIVETQDKIQEKIMSIDRGVHAEIKSVDSLASLNGSVLVSVHGLLSSQTQLSQRSFMQTFFLAPQEKGYFVLSDIRRFLDGSSDEQQAPVSDVLLELDAVNSAVEQVPEAPLPPPHEDVAESPVAQVDERELTDSYPESVEETKVYTSQDAVVEDDRNAVVENALPSFDEPVIERPEELSVRKERAEGAPPKMSYASILSLTSRQAGPRKPAAPTPTVSIPPTTVSQGVTQAAAASNSNAADDSVVDGGDAYSVYVKNLPLTISQLDLEAEFQKFGPVKAGGVNLRNQKQGVCFAFIQFEDLNSVRLATEASPISIGGRQVYIEEKKPTLVGLSAGRGRAAPGRSYQADGMNGRGNFGGRYFGRGGGYAAERDFSGGRGRGGRAPSYYGSNGNALTGFRRGDGNVGNGFRPPRRGPTE